MLPPTPHVTRRGRSLSSRTVRDPACVSRSGAFERGSAAPALAIGARPRYAAGMRREQVWKTVSEMLREDFGRLLDVRDVRRVRRVSGDAWVVTVALAASSGDLHVADVTVDDDGTMTPALGADHVVEAVRRAQRFSLMPRAPDELADFGDIGERRGAASLDMLTEMEEPVEVRVAAAIAKGDPESLAHGARASSPACSPITTAAARRSSRWPRSRSSSASPASRASTSRPPRASSPTASTSPRWSGPPASRSASAAATRSPARPSTRSSSRAARASSRSESLFERPQPRRPHRRRSAPRSPRRSRSAPSRPRRCS